MSTTATAGELGGARREPSARPLGAAMAAASVVLGLAAGALATSGQAAAVFGLGAIVVVVLIWRRPAFAPVVVLVAALTVEQFPFATGQPGSTSSAPTPSDFTDRIPLFRGLAPGIHVSIADLLLLTLLTFWLLKRGTSGAAPIPRTAVTACVGATVAAVAVGLVVGQTHHGELRTALTEVRPYVYLAIAFVLAAAFATRESVLRVTLWGLVLGTGLKSVQAIYSFAQVRHQSPRPDFLVGHEEALFFALFMVLTALLWIFQVPGRLRTVATWLFPLVLVADLVNSRRAAWLILGGAFIALTAMTMVAVPARRRFMTRILALLVVFSVFYFPAYWNHTGALAGPAVAVKSAIAPDTTDQLSDLYRVQENANLQQNIRQGGVLGKGFGVPIDYNLPITDISSIDPLIKFIPHNGVLYLFMRLGLFGALAFWCLLGAGIITGTRLLRSANREIAVFGALITCALVGYALEGYNDQGFFLYRVALVIGTLLGLGEGLRRIDERGLAFSVLAEPAPVTASAAARLRPAPARMPRAPRPATPAAAPVFADATPTRETSRDRFARLGALILLPFAVGFFVWLVVNGHKQSTSQSAPQVAAPSRAHDSRPAPAHPSHTLRGAKTLEITVNRRRLPLQGTAETTLTARSGLAKAPSRMASLRAHQVTGARTQITMKSWTPQPPR